MSHNILQVFGLLKYSVTSLFKKIFDRKPGLKCFFAKLASLRRLCSFEEGTRSCGAEREKLRTSFRGKQEMLRTPKDLLLLHSLLWCGARNASHLLRTKSSEARNASHSEGSGPSKKGLAQRDLRCRRPPLEKRLAEAMLSQKAPLAIETSKALFKEDLKQKSFFGEYCEQKKSLKVAKGGT